MTRPRALFAIVALILVSAAAMVPAVRLAASDTWTIRVAPGLLETPASGRLILFVITGTSPRWRGRVPVAAPFYEKPQPIFSVPVADLPPGGTVTIAGTTRGFPGLLDALDGPVRVQALLDRDQTERSHTAGPGNLYSVPVDVIVSARGADTVEIELTAAIERPPPPRDTANLKWIRFRSERLSAFYGRDVMHRAGVALPKGYLADAPGSTRRWPVVCVIPGYGGRDDLARDYAYMLAMRGTDEEAPQAVHIVLDPESPLGHHGFVDSPCSGPRGTALVEELIPYLKAEFRLVEEPAGWIVTGHSSGGWTSLWLQLRWPGAFGACWSSAPDPIDFTAFQMSDLYGDDSIYVDADGDERPSYREQVGPGSEIVRMTVRQEALMEWAIDPDGRSGQQWDAWEAMFSPAGASRETPRPLFDPPSGRIDHAVVEEHWSRFDIARLVRRDWDRYGPIVTGRVRIMCGSLDSYYLNRAVERFAKMVAEHRAESGLEGPGYVELYDGATHSNLTTHIFDRWNKEMRAYLDSHGWAQSGR